MEKLKWKRDDEGKTIQIKFESEKDFIYWLTQNKGEVLCEQYGRQWKYENGCFKFKDIGREAKFVDGLFCLHLFRENFFIAVDDVKKDLKYYRDNASEDYLKTPISVLKYITELENCLESTTYSEYMKGGVKIELC